MNKKIEVALKLLQQDKEDKMYQAMGLLLEVSEESPADLDPLSQALINSVIKKLVSKVEKSLGIKEEF